MNLQLPAFKNCSQSSRAAMNSSLYSDDDSDGDTIQAVLPRGIIPKPSSTRRNHRAIYSSESEDDQGHIQLYNPNKHFTISSDQPRPMNDITSLLRMMLINFNQRGDAGAGAGRSQLTINRNRRSVPGYSDSSDDGAGRSQLTINRNRRSVPGYSDSTDDEGLPHSHYRKDTIKHFSHPHALDKYNISSGTNCKVCGLQIGGSAYGCQSCQFYLHTSCFDLPQKIQHDAHTAHPLTLRYPSYYKHCGKTCDACYEDIRRSFLYCCDLCNFDLHVTCATLYSIVKRSDTSRDNLRLYYTFPVGDGNNNIIVRCNVCNKKVPKEGWVYYSKDTGHIAHIKCAKDAKVGPSWIKERLNMLKV